MIKAVKESDKSRAILVYNAHNFGSRLLYKIVSIDESLKDA